jgi:hypothetical protein
MSTLNSNTITSLASSDLLFSTNATERLRILLTSGNIGIGTASPANPLDVNGTVKSTGLYCTGNMGIGTTIPTAATVALQVNGTMKNTNPAFSVTYSGSSIPDAALSPTDLIFDTDTTASYLDVGNCFNTTNGTFTAPVEGYYFFSASILFNVNGTSPSAYGFWYFVKNGVQNHVKVHSPNTSTNYISYYTLSGTSIQHLNAGDYINIRYYGSPYTNGYAQWSGFLIG